MQIFYFCLTIDNSIQCFFILLDKYKICLEHKNDEPLELNKRSYWKNFTKKLGNKNFLKHVFIGEGEDLGEPDSSSDEDNDEESIVNEKEFKTNLQEAEFETPETMDVTEEEVEESFPQKHKFKNLD